MAANTGSENETYHEVPASQYWYLGDTIGAVPKNFFKYSTTLTIILTAASTTIALETDWWQRLLSALFFGSYWFIGWPAIAFFSVMFYLKRRSTPKVVKHK